MNPLVRRLLATPCAIYDAGLGPLLGLRFLRLTHTGRRSGRTYRTVLEVVARDDERGEVIVVAGLGPRSDWYRNLCAGHGVLVEVGRRRFRPDHRVLPIGEAATCLARYERDHRVIAPLVRVVLSRILGERYDGSAAARHRAAASLPLVGLRPAR